MSGGSDSFHLPASGSSPSSSKKVRNTVDIDLAARTVSKRYISGDLDERNRRLAQEAAALRETRSQIVCMRIPRLLEVYAGSDPTLIMEYMDHKETLKAALLRAPVASMLNHLEVMVSAAQELQVATKMGTREPEDLKLRVKKYGGRHAQLVGVEIIQEIGSLVQKLPPVDWSMVHNDFQLSNVLLEPTTKSALIDWEHYSEGTAEYELATMLASISILLGTQNRMRELELLKGLFSTPKDCRLFFICFSIRMLVEHGPAVARMEHGPAGVVLPMLGSMLRIALDQFYISAGVCDFIDRLSEEAAFS